MAGSSRPRATSRAHDNPMISTADAADHIRETFEPSGVKTVSACRAGVVLRFMEGVDLPAASGSKQEPRRTPMKAPEPTSAGYAEAAEGLHVHYEIYGEGEPI